MRILFIADVHIKLKQKKVPVDWQTSRFQALIEKINQVLRVDDIDLVVIGGDFFDSPKPSVHELVLGVSMLNAIQSQVIIYPGNHECFGKKESILEVMRPILSNRISVVSQEYRSKDFDIVPYTALHNELWNPPTSKLLFTHVRGAIGDLVAPEIDLSRLAEWQLVLAGDLHEHSMSQGALIYPGSPVNTSFSREKKVRENGYIIVDTETLEWSFHDLELPQLIRKTVTSTDEMARDPIDHVIYELEGDAQSLASAKDHELLDKKINTEYESKASLQLQDLTFSEELAWYLQEVQHLSPEEISRLITKVKHYD